MGRDRAKRNVELRERQATLVEEGEEFKQPGQFERRFVY